MRRGSFLVFAFAFALALGADGWRPGSVGLISFAILASAFGVEPVGAELGTPSSGKWHEVKDDH